MSIAPVAINLYGLNILVSRLAWACSKTTSDYLPRIPTYDFSFSVVLAHQ